MKNKLTSPGNAVEDNALDENKAPDEYQIKDWAETLMNAHEIKNNPHKMKHVNLHLKKKIKAITSIADLKALAKEKSQPDEF